MKEMLHGDKLVLSILKKELVILKKKAVKAKLECEAAMSVGSNLIALRAEAHDVIKDGMHDMPKEKLKKLEDLVAKEKKLLAIMRKGNLCKLMDADHEAEIAVQNLMSEIAQLEFRVKLQHRGAA